MTRPRLTRLGLDPLKGGVEHDAAGLPMIIHVPELNARETDDVTDQ
ncbi:MAG: hypothetical protein AB7E32_01180 [Desulfovibrio sp.]